MNFETMRENILTILTAAQGTDFDTHGGRVQKKGAGENILVPRVTVYFQRGNFPRSSSGIVSQTIHVVNFRIEFVVFVQHEADLSVLNDPMASAAQRALALQQLENPDLPLKADRLLDKTYGIVYQIIMNPNNEFLGFTGREIADRWMDDFQKDNPGNMGEYLALSGNAMLSARLIEPIASETGVPGVAFDSTINIDADQGDNLGTAGTLGG